MPRFDARSVVAARKVGVLEAWASAKATASHLFPTHHRARSLARSLAHVCTAGSWLQQRLSLGPRVVASSPSPAVLVFLPRSHTQDYPTLALAPPCFFSFSLSFLSFSSTFSFIIVSPLMHTEQHEICSASQECTAPSEAALVARRSSPPRLASTGPHPLTPPQTPWTPSWTT